MSRRTKEDWQKLIAEQANSGLSATVFCRNKGINTTYFSLRKSQLSKTSLSAFVPVRLSTPSAPEVIRIDYQGTSVVLPISFSPVWIAECVKQLSA